MEDNKTPSIVMVIIVTIEICILLISMGIKIKELETRISHLETKVEKLEDEDIWNKIKILKTNEILLKLHHME